MPVRLKNSEFLETKKDLVLRAIRAGMPIDKQEALARETTINGFTISVKDRHTNKPAKINSDIKLKKVVVSDAIRLRDGQ